MLRQSLRATAVLGLLMLLPVLSTTTAPAIAQETSDDDEDVGNVGRSELRDFLKDAIQARRERRDRLMDLLEERRDRRSALLDLLRERRDRRSELIDLLQERGERRGGLRSLLGEDEGGGGLRERLRKRFAERDGDECLIFTRTVRDQDRDFFVLVRRRICPDND